MIIKFFIQADKKHCGYCHFLHNVNAFIDGKEFKYCNAFTQDVGLDKKGRPLRVEDCKEAELSETTMSISDREN